MNTETEILEPFMGHIIRKITQVNKAYSPELIEFHLDNNKLIAMTHNQDCYETVTLEDICGDLNDIMGHPITMAERVTQKADNDPKCGESCTWTFYKLGTMKGSVTFRWFGESNGYYSEEVGVYVMDTQG